MSRKLIYIIFSTFIFLLGYISSDFVEAYETRENQYPPFGKEVVDVDGTKFLRDIKDNTNSVQSNNENFLNPLQKLYPSGCTSYSRLSEYYSCSNLFDNQNTIWLSSTNICRDQMITFQFKESIYLEFIVFENPDDKTIFQNNTIVKSLGLASDTLAINIGVKELEHDNTSQWIDINKNIYTSLTLKIIETYSNNVENQDSKCVVQEVTFYGRKLNY